MNYGANDKTSSATIESLSGDGERDSKKGCIPELNYFPLSPSNIPMPFRMQYKMHSYLSPQTPPFTHCAFFRLPDEETTVFCAAAAEAVVKAKKTIVYFARVVVIVFFCCCLYSR